MCSSRAIKQPALPLRRSSRLSLERYAHIHPAITTSARGVAAEKAVVLGEDIEDAITAAAQPRKRRRIGGNLKTGHIPLPAAADNAATDKPGEAPPKSDGRGRGRARKPDGRVVIADATTREPDMAVSPPNWEEMYQVLRRMRAPGGAASDAAVDTMGCERLADPEASPRDRRFHTLIALMLSSQTKDTVNAVVMRRLKTELPAWREAEPAGLNVENVLAVRPEMLNEMIWPVGFHNNKTKYIKQAAEILRDRWGSDIPDSVEGLMSLPGVGPKMAYLCMSAAWDRTEGIGVDVHVHRITNLWGWNGPARLTASPEATRLALQAWLPRDRWREINGLLVGLGQTVCLPVGRKCGDCDLGLQGLCRAAERGKVAQGRLRAEKRAGQGGGHTGEGGQSEEA